MASSTDIANMALDILKEAPISSLDDDRPIARWLKRNFTVTRNAVLERAEWNFSLVRAEIAEDATEPAFGWDYQYTIPADCIRVIPLTQDGKSEGRPILHEIEGGKILTNQCGPLKVRYVENLENIDSYPASFSEAVAARLAMKMAHWLTGKTSYVKVAQGLYDDAMETAFLSDAVQGSVPRAADEEWTDAR